ncbi:transmembrane protein 59-like [Eriocheir sinensis]|uniref:transmembrane protein 59-like n=1 Tax=Eriocheir sinensis TaxID=95602 RepID=UPI0021CAAB36|nr:transmembrane protein 59-like [Eriocheir sinensis]
MASSRLVIFAFASLFSLCRGLQDFESVLSNPKECEESCSKSYAPHTNPNGGESDACSRGCRLYTISEFVTRGAGPGEDTGPALPTTARDSCFGACVEAYNETSSNTVACKDGCDKQEHKTKASAKPEDQSEEGPSIHLLSPLVQVHSIYSSIVGAVHVVRSSIITYFAADDNSIVAVESAPKILVEVVGEEAEEGGVELSGVDGGGDGVMVLGKARLATMEETEASGASSEPSVVRCVSQRLGVPPPLLVASTLVLVLFTIYVIFAVCTTASPPKASKEGLSVQSDPMPAPIKLVRPEDLTRLSLMEEDDLQAPPLPMKVKLPDTHV